MAGAVTNVTILAVSDSGTDTWYCVNPCFMTPRAMLVIDSGTDIGDKSRLESPLNEGIHIHNALHIALSS